MSCWGFIKSKEHLCKSVARRGFVFAIVAASCTVASAEDRRPDRLPDRLQDQWGGSLAIASEYVYRGVSLSFGQVAYQGGLHLKLPSQWQVGVWGSTVKNHNVNSTPIETTGFIAHAWTFASDWNVEAGFTHYQYFGSSPPFGYDYDEVFASASYQSQWAVNVSWTPNLSRHLTQQSSMRASATSIDTTWLQPIVLDWSATAGFGYYDLSALYGFGYAFWHAGLTGPVGPVEVDLLYIDSGGNARYIYGESPTGERWAAIVRWRF